MFLCNKNKYMRIAFFIGILVMFFSCAKRGNPTGGPKDELAPIIIQANPPLNTVDFSNKIIQIQFDEYVKLKDVQKQLVISPPLKYKPVISPLGLASKKITIKIKDTLKQNTTYVFNFGNSIEDNNEGNIISNFKYVFSTGKHVDSLKIKGSVVDAFKEKTDKDIFVQLYDATSFYDSIIYKEKPLYITNTLDSTSWNLTNLKKGRYKAVALKDKNRDNLYNPKDDKIGFSSKLISLPKDSVINFKMFKEILDFKMNKPKEISKGHLLFGYVGNGDDIQISLENKNNYADFTFEQIKDEKTDTIHYFYKGIELDSLKFIVKNKDYYKILKANVRLKKRDTLNISLLYGKTLHVADTLTLSSNLPLSTLDNSKFSLVNKDTVAIPFNLKTVKNKIKVLFEREANQRYIFEVLPNAIIDFYGQTNDSLNFKFVTRKKDYYGSITLNIETDKDQEIIQLLDAKNKTIREQICLHGKQIVFNNLEPRTYKIRVIDDVNKNKKWDTGSFFKGKQPENVYYLKKEIKLQSNWFIKETIKF